MFKYFNAQINDKKLSVRNDKYTNIIYSCSHFLKSNNVISNNGNF